MYDVPGDGQCFFHALSLAITGNLSQSLVYRSLICSEIYNNFDFYEDQLRSYIDQNILYYNKNKIQIQMFVLFPNIFETKQYVKYVLIYIRSFKRSKYFIRFFLGKQTYLQSSVKQSKRDSSSQIIEKRCLFSFLIYSKLSNMLRILATDALQF
jgi:hypothetical protein